MLLLYLHAMLCIFNHEAGSQEDQYHQHIVCCCEFGPYSVMHMPRLADDESMLAQCIKKAGVIRLHFVSMTATVHPVCM